KALVICGLGFAVVLTGAPAQAQPTLASFALKSGESTDVTEIYFVANCRSLLRSVPEVTIVDGPPGVTATITEAMVLPRQQQCAKPVSGGMLKLTAGEIAEPSNTTITLRITYRTKDGNRQRSHSFNLALFP